MLARRSTWYVWALAASLAACDASDGALVRGGPGESCSARSDCEPGLSCLDQRCLSPAATTKSDGDAGTEPAIDPRGAPGESCTRRADCAAGSSCIAQVCVESTDKGAPMSTPLGDRGESCQARNDCSLGLACVMSRCALADSDVTLHAKQCFRVQCALDEDCCKSFVAPLQCATWKMACAAGDATACTQHNGACTCNLRCQNSACVPVRKCAAASDCTVNERCFAGACAQCAGDADCTVAGQRCLSGVCRASCERNEQCPLFHECKAGECSKVGCKSDRECYFASKSPLSRCTKSECVTPCMNDAQCPELQVCHEARCTFVGCESDEECRVLLNLASQPGNDRAVCRLPDR